MVQRAKRGEREKDDTKDHGKERNMKEERRKHSVLRRREKMA